MVRADIKTSALPAVECLAARRLQPYRFHVSEDLYTSILLHAEHDAGWTSVYHPHVEARMLSPWSMSAWAAQRLKYAGGTFDIAVWDNPVFRRGLTWRHKLHYGATFWSYFSTLWAPILLLAPVVSLLTGLAPVRAYSSEFFQPFLPAVVLGELAMLAVCKGHSIGAGRVMAIVALPLQWRALYCVLRRQKPQFALTPKIPGQNESSSLRLVWPHAVLLMVMLAAAVWGAWQTAQNTPGYSSALLWVKLFWLVINVRLVAQALHMVCWRPPVQPANRSPVPQSNSSEVPHGAQIPAG